jgi:branched-chain amino acid transport system ATP-binding protein
MLKVQGIDAGYRDLQALWDVSLQVSEGELVALVGPNGAGKSTTLKVISGLIKPTAGNVLLDGRSLTREPPHKIVDLGISQVLEGGRVFTELTVLENLELGSFGAKARKAKDENLERVFDLFPRLKERQRQRAGTLSGGERQMLAIGRALMSAPRLLMLDEPSFGLAPILVEQIFDMITEINRRGVTVLLVEQNVRAALELTQRAYVIENGRVVGEGSGESLLSFESIRTAYLGSQKRKVR